MPDCTSSITSVRNHSASIEYGSRTPGCRHWPMESRHTVSATEALCGSRSPLSQSFSNCRSKARPKSSTHTNYPQLAELNSSPMNSQFPVFMIGSLTWTGQTSLRQQQPNLSQSQWIRLATLEPPSDKNMICLSIRYGSISCNLLPIPLCAIIKYPTIAVQSKRLSCGFLEFS